MSKNSYEIGPFHLDRERRRRWRLREAQSPHRAFLSRPLIEHLAEDGHEDGGTLRQIRNVTALPDTRAVVTTPDTHYGYGSPIGCVYASPSTLSLSVVGVDISCGMAVVATNLHRDDLRDPELRRQILQEIQGEVPMGTGQARDNNDVVRDFPALVEKGVGGLRDNIIERLQLTPDSFEFEQDFSQMESFWDAIPEQSIQKGERTLGSLGGGNHFLEIQALDLQDPDTGRAWGLKDGQVVLMIHSGSRGFGYALAQHYDKGSRQLFERRELLQERAEEFVHERRIERCRIERRQVERKEFDVRFDYGAGRFDVVYHSPEQVARAYREADEELVVDRTIQHDNGAVEQFWSQTVDQLAGPELDVFDPRHAEADLPFVRRPLQTSARQLTGRAGQLAQGYWAGVRAGQNFAVLNRTIMLYRAIEVLGRHFGHDKVGARHLYDISHNNVQTETLDEEKLYVHRKGATRAFPAGHPALEGTTWSQTGHPVVVPGSMGSFSYLLKAGPGAREALYSVNHGAGRAMSRRAAHDQLDPEIQQEQLDRLNTVVVGATMDEMPGAYKDINEVVDVLVQSQVARVVARCHPLGTAKGDEDPID